VYSSRLDLLWQLFVVFAISIGLSEPFSVVRPFPDLRGKFDGALPLTVTAKRK
jgi:hypothetical protein